MTSFGTLEILSIVLFALVVAVLSALATSLVWRWLIRNDRVKYKSKDDIDRIENQKRHISNLRDIKRMVNTIDLVCDILHDEHTVLQDTYSYLKLMMKPGYKLSEHELDYLRQETNRKSKMLQKMISFSIETLQYERQMDVPREDFIAIVHLLGGYIYVDQNYTNGTSIVFAIKK